MSNIIERAKERKKNTTPFPGNMAKSKDEKKKEQSGKGGEEILGDRAPILPMII